MSRLGPPEAGLLSVPWYRHREGLASSPRKVATGGIVTGEGSPLTPGLRSAAAGAGSERAGGRESDVPPWAVVPDGPGAGAAPAATAPESLDDEIDIAAALATLWKRRWAVAVTVAVAVLTSGVLSFFVLPPVYEARAILMAVDARTSQTAGPVRDIQGLEGVVNYLSRIPELTVNTYVGQLTSPTILKRTREALKLDPEVFTDARLAGMVRAKAVKDTNLIELAVADTDPALATALVNGVTQEFVRFVSELNQEQLGRSVGFLEEQMKGVDTDLASARKTLQELEARPRGVAFLEQELKARWDDVLKAEADARAARVQVSLLQAGIAQAERSLAETPREIEVAAEGGGTARQANPAWTALAQALEERRLELAERQAQASALEKLAGDLREQLKGLQAELAAQRAEVERAQAEAKRLQDTRELLAQKITETRIARSVDLGQTSIAVVSPALEPSKPVKPKKALNLALALVLGLLAGVTLAFLLERLDNTVKAAEDVEEEVGLPVLGLIPDLARGRAAGA